MTTARQCYTLLKKTGWIYQSVETFNSRTQRRKDLFGFIDILAMHPEVFDISGLLAIQTFPESTLKEHLTKLQLPTVFQSMSTWLLTNNYLELWVWSNRKFKQKNGKSVTRKVPHFFEVKLTKHNRLSVTPNRTVLRFLDYELPHRRATDPLLLSPMSGLSE